MKSTLIFQVNVLAPDTKRTMPPPCVACRLLAGVRHGLSARRQRCGRQLRCGYGSSAPPTARRAAPQVGDKALRIFTRIGSVFVITLGGRITSDRREGPDYEGEHQPPEIRERVNVWLRKKERLKRRRRIPESRSAGRSRSGCGAQGRTGRVPEQLVTQDENGLLALDELAQPHRTPTWRVGALMRFMDWESDKQVSTGIPAALRLLSDVRSAAGGVDGRRTRILVDGTNGLAPGGSTVSDGRRGVFEEGQVGKAYLVGSRSDLSGLLGVRPLVDKLRDVLATAGQEAVVVAVPVRGQQGGYISAPVWSGGTAYTQPHPSPACRRKTPISWLKWSPPDRSARRRSRCLRTAGRPSALRETAPRSCPSGSPPKRPGPRSCSPKRRVGRRAAHPFPRALRGGAGGARRRCVQPARHRLGQRAGRSRAVHPDREERWPQCGHVPAFR